MKRRTFVLGIGTTTAGGSAILGTGAFSSVETQRAVTIETVGDEDAYLRLTYNQEIDFECETATTLLWITNQLKGPITDVAFDVVGTSDEIDVSDVRVPDELGVGEKGAIEATLICENAGGERTVNFDIEVFGDEFGVKAHRTDEISITCDCPGETAWALIDEDGYGTDPSRNQLNELDGIQKWGWYMPYEIGSGLKDAEFWSGAGQNDLDKGTLVGSVAIDTADDIDAADDFLTIDVEMDEDFSVRKSHLYVDAALDRLSDGRAAPGKLGYDSTDAVYDISEDRYEIPLDDGASDGETVYIALHGEVFG